MDESKRVRALLDERGIEHDDNDANTEVTGVRITRWKNGGKRDVRYEEWRNGTTRLDAGNVSPEQAIAATVTTEPCEPSKEWKAWHESLRHDNPTNVREVVESILFDAIEFGGDMGPNGNVCSGVDEGDVLTDGCINGWVKSIEEIAATVITEPDEATMFKLHERMNAALLDMQEELLAYHPRDRENASSKELIDCVIRAHQIIEDAATAGVGTCEVEYVNDLMGWHCKSCDTIWMGLRDQKPSYCMRCGKRVKEATE